MFQKIKEIIIGCLLILLIGVPFIVHCLYKIKSSNVFWIAEWSAGEFLAYYGSVLSFIATIMLSTLALWQNEIIRKESNRHTALLEEMEQNKYSPYFVITNIGEKNGHSNIIINISNITDNIALDIRILEKEDSFNRRVCFDEVYEILNAHDNMDIQLGNGVIGREDLLLMEIQCINIYGNKFSFLVRGNYSYDNYAFKFNVFRLKNK